MLNIYVNTWRNYNENGADNGEWITLPMDEDALREKLDEIAEKMHDDDPEWFVNDYEWTTDLNLFEVHEMDNYFELNEQLQLIDELDEYEQAEVEAAIEAFGYSVMDAIDKVQRGCFIFYREMDLYDVAYELALECYFTRDTPDAIIRYFDYNAFARDLGFDGYYETKNGVIVE